MKSKYPPYIEISDVLYEQVLQADRPFVKHYLSPYPTEDYFTTLCGRTQINEIVGTETEVTCKICRKQLGLEPFRYPQAKLL